MKYSLLSFKNVSIFPLRCWTQAWCLHPSEPFAGLDTLCRFYFTNWLTPGRLGVNTIYSNTSLFWVLAIPYRLLSVTCQWFGVCFHFSFPHYTKQSGISKSLASTEELAEKAFSQWMLGYWLEENSCLSASEERTRPSWMLPPLAWSLVTFNPFKVFLGDASWGS